MTSHRVIRALTFQTVSQHIYRTAKYPSRVSVSVAVNRK